MLIVGSFVKPSGRDGTWRLGIVEEVRDDGRYTVRAYVAPAGAYEGSAGVYRGADIVEVPRAEVEGALQVVRARIAQEQQLERQIEAALAASIVSARPAD